MHACCIFFRRTDEAKVEHKQAFMDFMYAKGVPFSPAKDGELFETAADSFIHQLIL